MHKLYLLDHVIDLVERNQRLFDQLRSGERAIFFGSDNARIATVQQPRVGELYAPLNQAKRAIVSQIKEGREMLRGLAVDLSQDRAADDVAEYSVWRQRNEQLCVLLFATETVLSEYQHAALGMSRSLLNG